MTDVRLRRRNAGPVLAGPGHPTRVMALIGASQARDGEAQLAKLDALAAMVGGPDVVADLSIIESATPLLGLIVARGFAASTLPVYTVQRRNGRIDRAELLDRAVLQMEQGASMLTIHPTPSLALIELARRRRVPWTSRGGGLIIQDLLAGSDVSNAYLSILPDLAAHARRHSVVLSLGASFRSANIFDSLDDAQQLEIRTQLTLADTLSREGTMIIIESPGHARPRDIRRAAAMLAPSRYAVMPLGPIPTDSAIGEDHVSAAIGATLMGLEGAAHVLAAVTREEHTGGIPGLTATLEAVRASRVAAHVIDIHMLEATEEDAQVVAARAAHNTCVAGKVTPGCSRCGKTCPL